MKRALVISAVLMALSASAAHAECVKKGAIATAGNEADAKWYALETMVQSVSWTLWPGFLQNGKVEGYSVSDTYKCSKDGMSITCRGQATFCKK